MYGTGTVGVTVGVGGLSATGFGLSWYVVVGALLLLSGLLLTRWGLRRGASH